MAYHANDQCSNVPDKQSQQQFGVVRPLPKIGNRFPIIRRGCCTKNCPYSVYL